MLHTGKREVPSHPFRTLTAALGLTLALYLGGTALGGWCIRMQKEYRIELFERAMEEQGTFVRILMDEEIQNVGKKYVSALADAVVRFEFFPRDDDAAVFFEIVSALPEGMSIERFAFSGRDMTIFCTAGNREALYAFSRALEGTPYFRSVSAEVRERADASAAGTLTCIAA